MVEIQTFLKDVKLYLNKRGFPSFDSPGLLQPKFNYAFSPSAGHHIIDDVVVSAKAPIEVIKFCVVPDRSMRIYDFSKIGVSRRHLSFFETIVFGYAGTAEELPKKEATNELYNLCLKLGLDKEKLLITVFGHAEAENRVISHDEDADFYKAWVELLGDAKVKRTRGRRNLFYSRYIGNPGGTGCELYYKIGDEYVEIGSQVNYKYKFTGGLEKTRNAAILQGFGFERLLMALEDIKCIGSITLFKKLKQPLLNYLTNYEDKVTTQLYDENLTKIADHMRALAFIVYDSKEKELSHAQKKILNHIIKGIKTEINYLGIYDSSVLRDLAEKTTEMYRGRYPKMPIIKEDIIALLS